jgi:hypothetical protein
MSPIRFLTLSLLLAGVTTAQVKTGETPPPKKGDGAINKTGEIAPPKKGDGTVNKTGEIAPPKKGDGTVKVQPPTPDKKPEQAPDPVDSTKLLEMSLEVAKREHSFLQEVTNSGGLLRRFKAGRNLAKEMIETFSPEMAGPAMPTKTKARLLGDGEKKKLAKDVIFTVESVPVTQKEYDATLAYLRSYPHKDSIASIETLAIAALVERKAGQSIHPKKANVALQIMTELAKRVKAGQKFSDLAGQYSEDMASASNGGKQKRFVRDEMDTGYAISAFPVEIGEVSNIAETRDGYHLVRVLGKTLGDTRDKDRILTAHIVRYYTDDEKSRAQTQLRIKAGMIDLAFRSDEMRKLAPAQFK